MVKSDREWAWATHAAGGGDIRIGSGASTVRPFLAPDLNDDLHLAVRPVLLDSGWHLWKDIDISALGYECVNYVDRKLAIHV